MKKIGKILSVASSSNEDSFGMNEADLGILLRTKKSILRQKADIMLADFSYLIDSM